MFRGRAPWIVAVWVMPALGAVVLLVSGTDGGSAVLSSAALFLVALAVGCAARAACATSLGARLVWAGRMLAMIGAAFAVVMPAILYQEIVMLTDQGRALTYDIAGAIWYEFRAMPLVILPALIAYRWARVGGVLLLLDGLFNVAFSLFQPFGVIYPDASGSGFTGVLVLDLVLQPAFVTAALLLVGGTRRSRDRAGDPGLTAASA
jgi:hypothetical protein